MRASILLITYNEERNLPACLKAVAWCDDILVVDSGSTDRTREIAERFGATVIIRPFDNFANQRNFGLESHKWRNEWILHLDADEIVTAEFRDGLDRLVATYGIDAYHVPSKMMLFGKWIKHAGMYPTYQVRLGHKERLRFVQVGHGQREACTADRLAIFPLPYLHYSFSNGLFAWLQKHARYARDEAEVLLALRSQHDDRTAIGKDPISRRRAAKSWSSRLPIVLRPLLRFFYVYVVKQGFRDGTAGLAYALMLSVYEGMTATLMIEALYNAKGVHNGPA